MNEETRVQAARMAVDLTIALMADKHGHLGHLIHEAKIPKGASPLAVFDECYSHLLAAMDLSAAAK